MDELHDYVLSRMPVLSRLMGREAVADVVRRTVVEWPCSEMAAYEHSEESQRLVLRRIRKKVAAEKRYGNPILILWGIGIIINLVWQWWLSRRKNQDTMREWQRAMEAGS